MNSSIVERDPTASEAGTAVRHLLETTPVSALMNSPVQCAKPSMTRAQVAAIMARAEIGAIPVVDDRGIVNGIVTKTDIVREDYGDARWQGAAGQVGRFMTPFLLRVRANDSLAKAIALMTDATVHHVVVVDSIGHAVGMLSTLDVVRFLSSMASVPRSSEDTISDRPRSG